MGCAAVRHHGRVRGRDDLAISVRPLRLDHPIQPAVREETDPHRKPAVPLRHPCRAHGSRGRPVDPGAMDAGRRYLGVDVSLLRGTARCVRGCGDPDRNRAADHPTAHGRPGLQCHDQERQGHVPVPDRSDPARCGCHAGRCRGARGGSQLPRGRLGVVPLVVLLPAPGGADGRGTPGLQDPRRCRDGPVHRVAVHPTGARVQRSHRLRVPSLRGLP